MLTSAPAGCHLGGMQPDDAAADDRHLSRQHAGHTAEQDAEAAIGLLQSGCTRLDRQAAGNFGHRRQQRQAAALVGHRLVGDGSHARGEQALGLFRIRGQMQIGVKKLAFAELCPFRGLRLLDLHDHVALLENILGAYGDLGAGSHIGVVIGTDAGTGLRLDPDFVAMGDVLANGCRRQADAVFVVLDFLGAANAHFIPPRMLLRLSFSPDEIRPPPSRNVLAKTICASVIFRDLLRK